MMMVAPMEVEDEAFNYSDLEDAEDEEMEDEENDDLDFDEYEGPLHSSSLNGGTFLRSKNDPQGVGLRRLLEASDWAGCLRRLQQSKHEVHTMDPHNKRTPLHVACQHDAPAVVLQELLRIDPTASLRVGTSHMNPLHVACSSRHASAHAIRALLEFGCTPQQLQMRDVDGDTPLHAACRCGAARPVLQLLLQAHPAAVHVRDKEGLTPLLRLWVRYFVILGDNSDSALGQILRLQQPSHSTPGSSAADTAAPELTGELLEAWNKTELLLRYAHAHPVDSTTNVPPQNYVFRTLHAVAAVDCPRPIVQFAATHPLYQHQLVYERDEQGRTPLMVACAAPVYPVRDLTDAGYSLEDVVHDDDDDDDNDNIEDEAHQRERTNVPPTTRNNTAPPHRQPSVIEILLHSNPDVASAHGARVTDPITGRLPLHYALATGKPWDQGVQALVQAHPESVGITDPVTGLFPFQLVSTAVVASDNATSSSFSSSQSLSSAFELLRRQPNLLGKRVVANQGRTAGR